MKITQERLNEIITRHGKWLRNEDGGEKADLRDENLGGADLRGADLRGANLRGANLCNADLCDADLSGINFSGANLCNADLCDADLSGVNFSEANLRGANLFGANLHGADLRGVNLDGVNLDGANLSYAKLDKTYYQITRIGSRNGTTTYCVEDNNLICGCWNRNKGGTLAEFKNRVESVYGENGKTPNKKYYTQYMAAIEFFTKMAKLAKE